MIKEEYRKIKDRKTVGGLLAQCRVVVDSKVKNRLKKAETELNWRQKY